MAYVVEHADVGMIEAGDGFGFALEALFADGIRGELLGENFDGDGAVQPRIYGAVNMPLTPATKLGPMRSASRSARAGWERDRRDYNSGRTPS